MDNFDGKTIMGTAFDGKTDMGTAFDGNSGGGRFLMAKRTAVRFLDHFGQLSFF